MQPKSHVGPLVNEAYLEGLRPAEPAAARHGNDMTRALGDAAGGSTFTHGGEVFTLSAPTVGKCAQFCEWCKRNAREELAEFAPLLPPHVYAASVAEFSRTARGTYVWNHDTVQAELRTEAGVLEWYRILLFDRHPALTADDIMEMAKHSGEKMKLAMKVFFPTTEAGGTTTT